tara:strand:- start:41 stop:559 length:519 start_codon:yes stop_codon:yes gene_type:complete
MARVTVEDCIDKVDSPYQLVLVAKERATQLNSGTEPTLDRDNDKNTVIALREIASENVRVSELTESAIFKLRKHVEQVDDGLQDDEDVGDDFENLYKGEISKSGTPILPSKRARKIPEKLQVSKEDIEELKGSQDTSIETPTEETAEKEVSLEELSDNENQVPEENTEDTNT